MRIFYTILLLIGFSFSQIESSSANGLNILDVNIIACDSINNTYDAYIVVDVPNLNIDSLIVNSNGNAGQTFSVGDSIIIYNIVPEPNTLFDFVLICATNVPDCCADFQYLQPDCLSSNNCSIEIEENILACDTTDGSYDVEVLYNITGSTSDFYYLYINGNIVDTFEIGDTLVVFDVMPLANSSVDVITICASDLNCCLEYEYNQPDCNTQNDECAIINIVEESIICHPDGSYDVTFYYDIENPSSDSIEVFLNNEFAGVFEISDSIQIYDVVSIPNYYYDYITICVNDNPDCCSSYEYIQPNCNVGDCEVVFIEEEIFSCDSLDGSYDMEIYYSIEDPNNDFLDLWVNNEYIGFYEIGDSLIVFDVEPRPNSNYDIIKICVNDNPNCCLEYEYLPPNCGSSNDCFIEEIEEQIIACDSINGTYDMEVYYNITNNSTDFYILYVNGNVVDTFQNGDDLVVLDVSPMSNSNFDVITICSSDLACCLEYEYAQPNCDNQNDECEVIYVQHGNITCNPNGSYDITFYYDIENPTSDSLEVFLNNEFAGFFAITKDISFDGVIPRPNSNDDIITICVDGNDDCCYSYEYVQPDCNSTNCEVLFIEEEIFNCDSVTGTYDMQIFYQIQNGNNNFVDLWVNNEYVDAYVIGDSIVLFDVTPRSNTSYDIITICLNDDPNCCLSYEYLQPDCLDDGVCSVNSIEESVLDCNADGSYNMLVFYDIDNADNEIMNVWVNNELAGNYEVGDSLYFSGVVPRPNSDFDIIEICLDSFPNCCLAYEYVQPDCDSLMACGVNINNVEIVFCDTITGHYNMAVSFEIENPIDDSVYVWVNDIHEATWSLEQSELLEDIAPNQFIDFDEVKICVGSTDECCMEFSYMQPICLASSLTNLSLTTQVQFLHGELLFTDLKNYQFMLTDVTGRKVMTESIDSNNETISVEINNVGIYFLTVYNSHEAASMKILLSE